MRSSSRVSSGSCTSGRTGLAVGKRYVVATLSLLLSLSACTRGEQGWKRIGKQEIQRILPQQLLAEALYDQQGLPDSLRILGYQTLLAEHGYSLRDWDSTLVWYGRNRAEDYRDLYAYAGEVLKQEQERLRQRVDSLAAVEAQRQAWQSGAVDSVNLLQDSLSLYRLGSYVERTFAYRPMTPYSSAMELRFAVRMHGLPRRAGGSTLRMQLRVQFADSTQRIVELSPLRAGLNELRLPLAEGQHVEQIFGVLRGQSPKARTKLLVVDSFSLARFPITSPPPATDQAPESVPADSLSSAPPSDAITDL